MGDRLGILGAVGHCFLFSNLTLRVYFYCYLPCPGLEDLIMQVDLPTHLVQTGLRGEIRLG